MKKIALILIALLIVTISLLFITDTNSAEIQKQIICGDNICDEAEESYCLDCNFGCKSELCNPKINIICDNCSETQKELLPVFFKHQNIIYDCLSDFFGYHPPRPIFHTISQGNVEPCFKEEGCYVSGGMTEDLEIMQGFLPGLIEYGETEVKKEENIGFEIHELTHVFTHYAFGNWVPNWFNEGISIYTESKFMCHHNQVLSPRLDSYTVVYAKLKANKLRLDEIAPFDEWYKTEHDSYVIGMLYFSALEQDYNCDKKCISKILYSLHQYRENCIGLCFEEARNSTSSMINSINMNDLRIKTIVNKIIKQKSEEIINQNLTELFNLLEIDYSS